jgi:hypothetical protein
MPLYHRQARGLHIRGPRNPIVSKTVSDSQKSCSALGGENDSVKIPMRAQARYRLPEELIFTASITSEFNLTPLNATHGIQINICRPISLPNIPPQPYEPNEVHNPQ